MRTTHQPRRSAPPLTPALIALTAVGFLLSAPATAQTYFTIDQTIAGGNPVNGDFTQVYVGVDSAFNPFPNVTIDVTGGTISEYIIALNQSVVNITGGTIGQIPSGGSSLSALLAQQGSTINLSAGTIQSFAQIGAYSSDGSASTLNMSGGTLPEIINYYGGVVNITGGNLANGFAGNYGDGTINVSGGTLNTIGNFGYEDGAAVNFGGTATANTFIIGNGVGNFTGGTIGKGIVQRSGVANVSGGSIGASGGFDVQGGTLNLEGSDFTVSATGTRSFFDTDYYANYIVTDFTAAGTLSDGTAFDTTVSGGDYSNDGTTLTFGGSTYAPDLFVTTDQTVSGIYNNINIGVDETFSEFSSPTAIIADGTDTVFVNTFSGSVTNMTGGIVRGDFYANDASHVNVSGGEIRGGLFAFGNNVLNVSGGSVAYGVNAYGDSVVTVSGGVSDSGYALGERATLTFQGSDFSASGTTERYWDGYTNYSAAGDFTVTGVLADGTAVNQTIRAGGVTGDAGQQTLVAGIAAPDLYLTEDGGVDTVNNVVTIGRNANGTTNTSPTVAINDGADLGRMNVYNESVLDILGGVVRGTIYTAPNTTVNIAGGTVRRITPQGELNVTGGDVAILDTYAGAQVRVTGGDITNILAYGYPGVRGDISIFGGSISSITGYGGAVNIHGGNVGAGDLINFRGSPFDLFGVGFSITNGMAGTYRGYNGVWWDVTGTLQSGQGLDTRYFEANGNLTGPANLTTTAAAPEPGALAFLLLGLPAFALLRRARA